MFRYRDSAARVRELRAPNRPQHEQPTSPNPPCDSVVPNNDVLQIDVKPEPPKARTINLRQIPKRSLTLIHAPEEPIRRPSHRGECHSMRGVDDSGQVLPCPFVSCRYHLYLDVNEVNGSIKLNFGDVDIDSLPQTCALDVAQEEQSLGQLAAVMNLTRERVRQIEAIALAKIRRALRLNGNSWPSQ